MKGSIVTHVMVHRPDGKRARITRGFHEERVRARRNRKAVPKIPDHWFK